MKICFGSRFASELALAYGQLSVGIKRYKLVGWSVLPSDGWFLFSYLSRGPDSDINPEPPIYFAADRKING